MLENWKSPEDQSLNAGKLVTEEVKRLENIIEQLTKIIESKTYSEENLKLLMNTQLELALMEETFIFRILSLYKRGFTYKG